MRNKKPMQNNGYNNQHRRPRYQGGGGGGGNPGNHGNRPRRNYGAAREKYLNQARDALASGDRVLAENFLQHADHCYRMMVEEGQNRPRPQAVTQSGEEGSAAPVQETEITGNSSALPAFITGGYEQQQQQVAVDPATIQNWEERDA